MEYIERDRYLEIIFIFTIFTLFHKFAFAFVIDLLNLLFIAQINKINTCIFATEVKQVHVAMTLNILN